MEVGDAFPKFELKTQDDETISSDDLKGQAFVLFAYPKALTPGCTKEACSVRDHYKELTDRNVRPLGISNDPPSKNKKFAEKHDLQYTLLSDEDNELLTALDTYGMKKMYGKEYMGTLRKTFIVDTDGKVRKIFNKVKTATHGEEILEALDELGL